MTQLWGQGANLGPGAQARLIDVALPEPRDLTIYVLPMLSTGGVAFPTGGIEVSFGTGSAMIATPAPGFPLRVTGNCFHVVAAQLRVAVRSTLGAGVFYVAASAAIGRPVVDQLIADSTFAVGGGGGVVTRGIPGFATSLLLAGGVDGTITVDVLDPAAAVLATYVGPLAGIDFPANASQVRFTNNDAVAHTIALVYLVTA